MAFFMIIALVTLTNKWEIGREKLDIFIKKKTTRTRSFLCQDLSPIWLTPKFIKHNQVGKQILNLPSESSPD